MKKLIIYCILGCILLFSCNRSEKTGYVFLNNHRIISESKSEIWEDLQAALTGLNHRIIDSDYVGGKMLITGEFAYDEINRYINTEEFRHITAITGLMDTTRIEILPAGDKENKVIVSARFILMYNQEIPRGKFSFGGDYKKLEESKGVFENIILDKLDKWEH